MAWYPKAIRKEITRHRTLRVRKGRVCLHVAVSEGSSLFGYFNQKGNPTSHFYVRRDGTIEQYVDTKYRAPANLEGNSSLISFETQGGVKSADTEPWTAAQVNAIAECIAWLHKVESVPLQIMPNSKSSTLGVGYHKLGVDPYRVSGGEKWSSAYGKICPGGGKIKQIPTIISKAKALVSTPPVVPSKPTPPKDTPEKDWFDVATPAEIKQAQYEGTLQALIQYGAALFKDGSGTADAIWDQARAGRVAQATQLDAIGKKLDALNDNIAKLAEALAPKA